MLGGGLRSGSLDAQRTEASIVTEALNRMAELSILRAKSLERCSQTPATTSQFIMHQSLLGGPLALQHRCGPRMRHLDLAD